LYICSSLIMFSFFPSFLSSFFLSFFLSSHISVLLASLFSLFFALLYTFLPLFISTFVTGYKQWRSSVVRTVINLRIPQQAIIDSLNHHYLMVILSLNREYDHNVYSIQQY
jgi:hypothetical protein